MAETRANPASCTTSFTACLLLLAGFLMGIGYIAILPPFEGFDETAHFSRIIEYATPKSIREQEAPQRISQQVYDYFRQGPMPEAGWIQNGDMHGNDPLFSADRPPAEQFWSYSRFFKDPAKVQSYKTWYLEAPFSLSYQASNQNNWVKVHPPLYYYSFATVLNLLPPIILKNQLLILRVFSFALAFSGLTIGLWASRQHWHRHRSDTADALFMLAALYPFLMPSFFGGMARLGNDSLCLILFGLLWAFLLQHIRAPQQRLPCLSMGILLALGVSTKILMLPIAVSTLGFLLIFNIMGQHGKGRPLLYCLTPVLLVGTSLMIGYGLLKLGLHQIEITGTTTQTISSLKNPTSENGDFIAGLVKNLTLAQWLYGMKFMVTQFIYLFNSWSLISAGTWVTALASGAVAVIAMHSAKSLWQARGQPLIWLLVMILFSLFGGVLLFLFLSIVRKNDPLIPGHYLHIIAPATACCLAYGLLRIARGRFRTVFYVVLPLWLWVVNWSIIIKHLQIFSGCTMSYSYFPTATCTQSMPIAQMIENLALLAHPMLGIACFTISFIALGWGLIRLRQGLPSPVPLPGANVAAP